MSKPTVKAESIENFIDSITQNPLGRRGSITNNVCAICEKEATKFRDALSRKEYTISGMCQECQDDMWGGKDSLR